MADRDVPQLPADEEEQEMQPTNTSHMLQQERTQDEKQQHPEEESAPSSASTNGKSANSSVDHLGQAAENISVSQEASKPAAPAVAGSSREESAPSSASRNGESANSNVKDLGQAVLENTDSTGENMAPHREPEAPSSDEPSTRTVEDDNTPPQADEGSHGDGSGETPGGKQLGVMDEEVSEKSHMMEQKEPPVELDQGDREDEQVDGPNASLDEEETPDTNDTATEVEEDNKSSLREQEGAASPLTARSQEDEREDDMKREKPVENIGPFQEDSQRAAAVDNGSSRGLGTYLVVVGVVVLVVAFLVQQLIQRETPPQRKDALQINIFLGHMEKLKAQFPHQRAELWSRSRIHLLKHLQTAQPTEPVSLILTAGVKAERTLRCLAQGLASAFSSALNASVLHIDGAGKASQDSDQVKLEIDSSLQGAFEGDKPVAVIHRFEELPPGSTLIFYRYCDHENAAYKKTFLIFTVLLEEEEEIPAKSRLNAVEEMVDDHLQKKFLSDGPVSFDRMDLDKYGGLWSRISHLILPVAAEEIMEHEGC